MKPSQYVESDKLCAGFPGYEDERGICIELQDSRHSNDSVGDHAGMEFSDSEM